MHDYPAQMDQAQLQSAMLQQHQQFIHLLQQMDESAFVYHQPDKWSAGMQLAHMNKSLAPVILAFSLPKFLLRLVFGKMNRSPKSYADIVTKYSQKIAAGQKATAPYIPKPVAFSAREKLIQKLTQQVEQLNHKIARCSAEELDTLLLPHPILGKITLREMIYFCIYHVAHHEHIIQRDSKPANT